MKILYIIFAIISWLIGMQVSAMDIKRVRGKIRHAWMPSNTIAVICAAIVLTTFVYDFIASGTLATIAVSLLSLLFSAVWVWVMGKLNTKRFFVAVGQIIVPIIVAAYIMSRLGMIFLTPFAVFGLYYRNNPFGNLFGKRFLLIDASKGTEHDTAAEEGVQVDETFLRGIRDFSYAGCWHDTRELPVYDVTKEGIKPNAHNDILPALQALVDKAGASGGGRIFFPRGRYLINNDNRHPSFLQINHSNITLEGETDSEGNPLAEIMSGANTVNGTRNPWISPFMITTGEKLQQSNIFFGIQFKKKKNVVMRSGSPSDPGSDSTILTPEKVTPLVRSAKRGDTTVVVRDVTVLKGSKYALLAAFNNPDGDLIRDILDVKELHPEWKLAHRAGPEGAPSYQDLIEISGIDEETSIVTLTQPLRRDMDISYSPALYPVEMLENVCIRNLRISSRWNGLFRHHGFIIYYSSKQDQEMDYGWNGINMKRVAHGKIENVVFKNLTNPLYIMDSKNITIQNILITGYDGHQGIKLYSHACDNLIRHVEFKSNYADMMGCEGNAYGNVFSDVWYTNPYIKPVDFDFHGFSEGPFSPPSYNLFEDIHGFRHIKGAGALYYQPACARENVWWNIETDGGSKTDCLFVNALYASSKSKKTVTAMGHAVLECYREKNMSVNNVRDMYKVYLHEKESIEMDRREHYKLFARSLVVGLKTTSTEIKDNVPDGVIRNVGDTVTPRSLYDYQLSRRTRLD